MGSECGDLEGDGERAAGGDLGALVLLKALGAGAREALANNSCSS